MDIRGNLMKLESPTPPERKGGGIRGAVEGFSKASRRRLLYQVAMCGDATPIFVTLTYGREWASDGRVWKRDLQTWWKRLVREDPTLAAIWKLEFQRRGAPHFHLFVYRKDEGQPPFLDKRWVAQTWAEVTGDETEAHVRAGTRVESIRSRHGAMFYAAKYMGKEDGSPPGPDSLEAGRVWGVLGRENLPVKATTVWLSPMEAAAFRYHLALAAAQYRARKQAKKEGVCFELSDDRAAELLPGFVEELVNDPLKIPKTRIENHPKMVLAGVRHLLRNLDDVPDADIVRQLDRLCRAG